MSDVLCHCGNPELPDDRGQGMCSDCRLFLQCDDDKHYCEPAGPPPPCDCFWKEPHSDFNCPYQIRSDYWEMKVDREKDAEIARLRAEVERKVRVVDGQEFRVVLTEDGLDGGWFAECIDLPGCLAQGSTRQEALHGLVDAAAEILSVRRITHN